MSDPITVTSHTDATIEQAWACFTTPDQITRWNFATDEWSCPEATTDLRAGGAFSYLMAARDGSMAFDYAGTWDVVEPHRRLVQVLDDGRRVEIRFEAAEGGTRVTEVFDPDGTVPRDMQQAGWQLILDRFARVAGGAG